MSVVVGCADAGARFSENAILFWILARRRAALLACITDVSLLGECRA